MKKLIVLFLVAALLLCGCGITHDGGIGNACDGGHSDANRSGDCDRCGVSVMTTFDLYSVNDLHGKLSDGDNHPGVDELTTYLKNARKTDDNVILLSTGDMWQGTAESNLTGGLLVTDWMNEMDFTAMAMGNHEFDWGEEAVERNAEFAQFPFLAINIYDRTTNSLVDYCDSSVVVEFEGIQVGIIGAIGDCYSSIAVDKVEDIFFKTGKDLTALVKAEAEKLRSEGVDFIVYCIHDGYGSSGATPSTSPSSSQLSSYYDTSLSNGYVDLVFEGHTHQQYLIMDQYGVLHLQNRGDNRGGISHVEVSINTVTGDWSINLKELVEHGKYTSLQDDPLVEQLLNKYSEQTSQADRVVGTTSRFRNSTYLRKTVAQLYYELGVSAWSDTYKITLGGGFISVRSPYELQAGQVTYGDLQNIFPFDNDIVLCSVKGSDLLNKFINSSNSNYYIAGDNAQMAAIDPSGTYYIVVDTYTAYYAPNRLTVVEEYQTGIYARDLLADFIGSGGME